MQPLLLGFKCIGAVKFRNQDHAFSASSYQLWWLGHKIFQKDGHRECKAVVLTDISVTFNLCMVTMKLHVALGSLLLAQNGPLNSYLSDAH